MRGAWSSMGVMAAVVAASALGCQPEADPPRSPAPAPEAVAPTAAASIPAAAPARPSASITAAASAPTALASATAAASASAAPPAEPGHVEKGLPGTSYDYAFDGGKGTSYLRWRGRAFLSPRAEAAAAEALPLVLFLHGLNAAQIRHRWMGGGNEGDVRAIVGKLIEDGRMAPAIVAGPGSTVASQVARGASWRGFDIDNFLQLTQERLRGIARIDEKRIVVAGHSGAGCSPKGGLATVAASKRKPHAIVVLDTCLEPWLGDTLGATPADIHLVVSYQRISWQKRAFGPFLSSLKAGFAAHPANPGVLREVQKLTPRKAAHDSVVPLSLNEWLPKLLPPTH